MDCVNEDLLHIDEYVSDTESIYSIISVDEIHGEVDDLDTKENEFSNSLIEQSSRLKGHLASSEKLEKYHHILEEL